VNPTSARCARTAHAEAVEAGGHQTYGTALCYGSNTRDAGDPRRFRRRRLVRGERQAQPRAHDGPRVRCGRDRWGRHYSRSYGTPSRPTRRATAVPRGDRRSTMTDDQLLARALRGSGAAARTGRPGARPLPAAARGRAAEHPPGCGIPLRPPRGVCARSGGHHPHGNVHPPASSSRQSCPGSAPTPPRPRPAPRARRRPDGSATGRRISGAAAARRGMRRAPRRAAYRRLGTVADFVVGLALGYPLGCAHPITTDATVTRPRLRLIRRSTREPPIRVRGRGPGGAARSRPHEPADQDDIEFIQEILLRRSAPRSQDPTGADPVRPRGHPTLHLVPDPPP